MFSSIKKEVYWYTKKTPVTQPLTENISADVVVVGGGVAGLTVADRLSREGKRVVLLEREFCGAGASGKSSGMIAQDSELGLAGLVDHCGANDAKLLWEFVGGGIEIMRRNIKENNIECDYQEQDYVFMANSSHGFKKVLNEHNARKLLGYEGKLYDEKTVRDIIGSSGYVGALRYPGTFAINSYLYVQGMREILLKRGVKIFEKTEVTGFDKNGVTVKSKKALRVNAEYIVICVDRFLPELKRFKKDVYHVETYLTISKPLSDSDALRLFPAGNILVADSDMIYQYYRITGDRRLLLGGGNYVTTYAYKQSKKPEHIIPKLTRYIQKNFPEFNIEVEYIWPGLLGVSKDLVPLMGADPALSHVYYITTATGLAWATALGDYVGEKILEGRSDYDEVFSLRRKFPFDPFMRMFQNRLTTPMAFGLSHAFVTYLR